MNNELNINWANLEGFTSIPLEISSICKYKGKKFSSDHKSIYSYLSKLQYDGKLNKAGFQSYDTLMARFGIGSKGSLTGYIDHLVKVGLLIKSEVKKGVTNQYEVMPLLLEHITYPAKSHRADSNKIKRETKKAIQVEQDTPKKVNNYPILQKYRKIYDGDKLKAFNKWGYEQDKADVQIKTSSVQEWSRVYESSLNAAQKSSFAESQVSEKRTWKFTPSSHVLELEYDEPDYDFSEEYEVVTEEQHITEELPPLTREEMNGYIRQLQHVPRDAVSTHKERLKRLAENYGIGVLCNAMTKFYAWHGEEIKTSPVVATAAIRALLETGLYAEIQSREALETGLVIALKYVPQVQPTIVHEPETEPDDFDMDGVPF